MKLEKIYNDIIKAYFADNYNSRFAFEESGDYVYFFPSMPPAAGYRIPKNLWIFDFKDKYQSISLGSIPERAPELFNDTDRRSVLYGKTEPCEPTPLRRSVLYGKKKIDLVKIGNYWYQEKFITKIGKIEDFRYKQNKNLLFICDSNNFEVVAIVCRYNIKESEEE